MRYITSIGSIITLCVATMGGANAATAQYSSQLDLTDLQYPVTINNISGNAAADIVRYDLGAGWTGEMDIQLTTSSFNTFTTSIGIALTTDPNDALYDDPSAFFQLTDPTTVSSFFNDNVIGWELYSWGTPNITAGGTTDITDQFSPMLFDPNEHYYAFIAGGSVSPTTIDVDLTVSSVPVPAAVWLFGSGILGLIGMTKRKNSAAKAVLA